MGFWLEWTLRISYVLAMFFSGDPNLDNLAKLLLSPAQLLDFQRFQAERYRQPLNAPQTPTDNGATPTGTLMSDIPTDMPRTQTAPPSTNTVGPLGYPWHRPDGDKPQLILDQVLCPLAIAQLGGYLHAQRPGGPMLPAVALAELVKNRLVPMAHPTVTEWQQSPKAWETELHRSIIWGWGTEPTDYYKAAMVAAEQRII